MNDRLNDLGIASYSLHFFIAISDCRKKIQNAIKNTRLCMSVHFTISVKQAIARIAFNDLTVTMCNYLRATPRISFCHINFRLSLCFPFPVRS